MIRRVACLTLALAASAFPAPAAGGPPPPGSFFIRLAGTVGNMPMHDFDHYFADNVSPFVPPGTPPSNPSEFGTSGGGGGEFGYMLNDLWSVGFAVTNNSTSGSTIFGSLFSGLGTTSLEAGITDATANVMLWSPGLEGLFLGAEAGMGFGRLEEEFSYSDYSGNAYEYNGRWRGSGFAGGLFAGFEHRFEWGLRAYVRGGYKYRPLGAMPGHRTVTRSTYSAYPTGTTAGPIRDSSGRALKSDFSIGYASLGIGWAFGE